MLGTTWLRNGQMNRSRIRFAPRQYSQGAAETPKNIDCWDAAESLSLPGLRSLVEAAAAIVAHCSHNTSDNTWPAQQWPWKDDAGRLARGTIQLPTRRRWTSEDSVQRNTHGTRGNTLSARDRWGEPCRHEVKPDNTREGSANAWRSSESCALLSAVVVRFPSPCCNDRDLLSPEAKIDDFSVRTQTCGHSAPWQLILCPLLHAVLIA
jgi:hypothetical protein